MILLGLTGSIGMGKSTTAEMFAAHGDPVYDADKAVHRLYQGAAVDPVGEAFPDAIVDGAVDRKRLAERVLGDPVALTRLEAIVHPLVRDEEARFIAFHKDKGRRIAVLDIPLLFETGRTNLHAVVLASAPAAVQRARVLARDGMSEDRFEAIVAKQMPDADKRRRAHFIVETGAGMEAARIRVAAIRRAVLSMGK
ncbi:MAG: dephospho-CoA kinase [Pseudomonadota bacterium]